MIGLYKVVTKRQRNHLLHKLTAVIFIGLKVRCRYKVSTLVHIPNRLKLGHYMKIDFTNFVFNIITSEAGVRAGVVE